MIPLYPCWGSIGGSVVKNQPTIAGTTGGLGAIPGLGRSLGEGNGNPLQHSCLGNPMDRGAWQATVHGVAKTWTWLNNWTTATPLLEWTKSGMQTSQTPVRMWANGSSRRCRWERNVVQPLWKMACWFLAKADELIPCDPAVVLLGIYPKELKMYVPGKTSTRMFIKALFKIANTWKQPRCPSVGGWIVKLWSIQTMGYYSTLSCSTNRQGGLFSTGMKWAMKLWRNLKCLWLSETHLSERAHTAWSHWYDILEKPKSGRWWNG